MNIAKLFSVFCGIIAPLPMILSALISVYGKIPVLPLSLALLGGAAAWLLGTLIGMPQKKANERKIKFLRALAAVGGIVVGIAAEAAVTASGMGSLAVVFLPIAEIFWYWFGQRAGSGLEILPPISIGAFCLEDVVAFGCCGLFEGGDAARIIILVISALFLVLASLVMNRRHLARLAMRGKNTNSSLTRAAGRYNIKLTAIFSCSIVFLFFFSFWGAEWLWNGIKALISWLVWVFGNMGDGTDGEYLGGGGGVFNIVQKVSESVIAQIILGAVIVAMLALALKPLIRIIGNFAKRKSGRDDRAELDKYDYVDFYEETSREKRKNNTFGKAMREFRREREPNKKYRLGYKAFMIKLGNAVPSDTTGVHIEKAGFGEKEDLKAAAEMYDKIRYNDEKAELSDCEKIAKILSQS